MSNIVTSEEVSSRGRPKDASKRDEIVAAATRLFMEKGYELTSMEAVAREAGVSKLTIYSHFSDKSQLFRAVIGRRCDQVAMPDTLLSKASLPVDQALRQIAEQVANVVFRPDSIHLVRVIQAEAARHPEMVAAFQEAGPKRVREAFAELLREFDRRGALKIADPVRATEQFFSLLKGERLMRSLMLLAPPPSEAELAAHIEATVSFFLAACRNGALS